VDASSSRKWPAFSRLGEIIYIDGLPAVGSCAGGRLLDR
jgi:hypothetical protein